MKRLYAVTFVLITSVILNVSSVAIAAFITFDYPVWRLVSCKCIWRSYEVELLSVCGLVGAFLFLAFFNLRKKE